MQTANNSGDAADVAQKKRGRPPKNKAAPAAAAAAAPAAVAPARDVLSSNLQATAAGQQQCPSARQAPPPSPELHAAEPSSLANTANKPISQQQQQHQKHQKQQQGEQTASLQDAQGTGSSPAPQQQLQKHDPIQQQQQQHTAQQQHQGPTQQQLVLPRQQQEQRQQQQQQQQEQEQQPHAACQKCSDAGGHSGVQQQQQQQQQQQHNPADNHHWQQQQEPAEQQQEVSIQQQEQQQPPGAPLPQQHVECAPEQQQQQAVGAAATPKRRGRPPGVKNKATLAKEGTAGPLMTYLLTVQPGEDVYAKLQDVASDRKCCLTVLAASGALSAATLTQRSDDPKGAGEVGVTLTGLFTILSISGTIVQEAFLPPQHTPSAAGTPGPMGPHVSLSASLANSGGGVVGGTVAGPLTAASPVLLVLGLFGQG